ncbi:hypothetical protein HMPREF9997_02821 [Corynebacterium durum F0235]|uniref:Uncharacterized protein n=1 Tax=Corynebacterium durum F0235 TaxID=1035195 RepID=L1M8W9_9CORY|nr:hypothetical protein HMPREF9997_02821 [Corynebacterium durum F0235]
MWRKLRKVQKQKTLTKRDKNVSVRCFLDDFRVVFGWFSGGL